MTQTRPYSAMPLMLMVTFLLTNYIYDISFEIQMAVIACVIFVSLLIVYSGMKFSGAALYIRTLLSFLVICTSFAVLFYFLFPLE